MESSNHLKTYFLLKTRVTFNPAMVSLENISWGKFLQKTTRAIHRTLCVEKQPLRGIVLAGTGGYEEVLFRFARKIYRCGPIALRICLNWSCTWSKPDVALCSTTSCLRSRLHNNWKPQPHQHSFAHAIAAAWLRLAQILHWGVRPRGKGYIIFWVTHPHAFVFGRRKTTKQPPLFPVIHARPADAGLSDCFSSLKLLASSHML